MSLCQTLDCVCKYWVHVPHMLLLYGKPGRIPAGRKFNIMAETLAKLSTYRRCKHTSTEPNCIPLHVMCNHLHVNGFGLKHYNKKLKYYYLPLTFILPQLKLSLSFNRASTVFFISRCSLLPKSLNIVEPPESTIFLYKGLLTSIGQF